MPITQEIYDLDSLVVFGKFNKMKQPKLTDQQVL